MESSQGPCRITLMSCLGKQGATGYTFTCHRRTCLLWSDNGDICTQQLPRGGSHPWGTAWTHHLLKLNVRIKYLFLAHISKMKFKKLLSNEIKGEVGPISVLFANTDCWEISKWKEENKNRITLLILEISNSKGCLYRGSCGQQHIFSTLRETRDVSSPSPQTLKVEEQLW